MPGHREVELDPVDHPLGYQAGQERDEDVVLVFTDTVAHPGQMKRSNYLGGVTTPSRSTKIIYRL